MFQKMIAIGNISRDPMIQTVSVNGEAVKTAKFTVCVNDGRGENRKVEYFRVTAWRALADSVEKWYKKGDLVQVEGKVHLAGYVDQNRQYRTYLELVPTEMHNLTKKADTAAAAETAEGAPAAEAELPF